jgi:Zn-dependent peptidase ImmA (M78 family)/transcriptional regulator with XRE-family HTH domain
MSGFMLTLARESAGLTQVALAHACGVSQSRISNIELGVDEPDDELAAQLARNCAVPVELLYSDDAVHGQGVVDIFHRKRATLPAKALRQANATVNLMRLEISRLVRTVDMTETRPLPVVPDGIHLSPTEAAEFVRATWRIPNGPLPNLIELIESTGTPVCLVDMGHRKLGAMSMPDHYSGFIIALNRGLPASNRRFGLAHELGHIVMHGGAASADIEKEADEFASALLMPADDIRPQLRNLRFSDLGPLKLAWRVSLAALIRTARDLGSISDRQYRTFNMNLNKFPGGRMNEPGEFEAETPRLVKHLIDYFQNDRGLSTEQIAKMMLTTPNTLRHRYLGEVPAPRPISRPRGMYSVPPLPPDA